MFFILLFKLTLREKCGFPPSIWNPIPEEQVGLGPTEKVPFEFGTFLAERVISFCCCTKYSPISSCSKFEVDLEGALKNRPGYKNRQGA